MPTVAHELLNVDAALWRTLRLLFVHPGRLSLEYAAGRRRPYLNPFRLLLIAIVAYALISSLGFVVTWNFGPVTMSIAPPVVRRSNSVEDTIEQVDGYGLLRQQVAAKRTQLASEAGEAPRLRLEEVAKRGVIEQLFRFDGLNLAGRRIGRIMWRGPMTPPPGVFNTLDLTVDPQLVHDLAKTFNAGVGDKRAKLLRFVPAIRFHVIEDESGVFAQRMMHDDVSVRH